MQIYTSEKRGSDTTGDGTEKAPLKTILQAIAKLDGKIDADTCIWVDGVENEMWDPVSKSKLKKMIKQYHIQERKHDKVPKRKVTVAFLSQPPAENGNLSEAVDVQLTLDTKLPEAKQCKIRDLQTLYDQRVRVYGWVHRIRRQSKTLMFIVLRDGTGFLQCLFSNNLVSFVQ
ncbi:hypothetical protein MS3_00009590 [Schistosoma haematobium]|uniref:OB domain-containing protein n=1 Tax=Schistosoma haematobium TaxID=6185 RepID=A0A922LDB2_SCHHA|nr:hypothetical protein MS3_00009590 [Schistosoma haematobium]KAH9579437.1 hypothetical protein MS3_00009590 [Schistosoma haematobium]